MAASMTAQLTTWDHNLLLAAADNPSAGLSPSVKALWGSPSVEAIVNQLAIKGIMNVDVIQDKTDFSIIINDPDSHPGQQCKAVVKLSQSATNITTNDEVLRSILTDVVLAQCTLFNKST